jgi:hypothetical protein
VIEDNTTIVDNPIAPGGAPADPASTIVRFSLPAWLPVPGGGLQFEINRAPPSPGAHVRAQVMGSRTEQVGFVMDMFPDRQQADVEALLRGRSVEEVVMLLSGETS